MEKNEYHNDKAQSKPCLDWTFKAFKELTTIELYGIWKLREETFIVEQQAIYLDADGLDLSSTHVLGTANNQLIAYARILNLNDNRIQFGRVCVSQAYRKCKLGTELVRQVLLYIASVYPNYTVQISAQYYLTKFYESFSFAAVGEKYNTEAGVVHIDMQLKQLEKPI